MAGSQGQSGEPRNPSRPGRVERQGQLPRELHLLLEASPHQLRKRGFEPRIPGEGCGQEGTCHTALNNHGTLGNSAFREHRQLSGRASRHTGLDIRFYKVLKSGITPSPTLVCPSIKSTRHTGLEADIHQRESRTQSQKWTAQHSSEDRTTDTHPVRENLKIILLNEVRPQRVYTMMCFRLHQVQE